MTETTPPDDTPLVILKQLAAETESKTESLKAEVKRQQSLRRILEDLKRFTREVWPLHVLDLCDRNSDLLKSFREEGHACVPVIETLYAQSRESAKNVVKRIPRDIENLSKEKGLPLDLKQSRHPNYFFGRGGFLKLTIDEKNSRAKLSTREGNITSMPADSSAVMQQVESEISRLFGRRFDGAKFIKHLFTAYQNQLKSREGKKGDPVPIRKVLEEYLQLKPGSNGTKLDEVLVDLSQLVEQGPAEVDGWHFEFQQTKDAKEGLMLIGKAGQGMVNLIVFKKKENVA